MKFEDRRRKAAHAPINPMTGMPNDPADHFAAGDPRLGTTPNESREPD